MTDLWFLAHLIIHYFGLPGTTHTPSKMTYLLTLQSWQNSVMWIFSYFVNNSSANVMWCWLNDLHSKHRVRGCVFLFWLVKWQIINPSVSCPYTNPRYPSSKPCPSSTTCVEARRFISLCKRKDISTRTSPGVQSSKAVLRDSDNSNRIYTHSHVQYVQLGIGV